MTNRSQVDFAQVDWNHQASRVFALSEQLCESICQQAGEPLDSEIAMAALLLTMGKLSGLLYGSEDPRGDWRTITADRSYELFLVGHTMTTRAAARVSPGGGA